MCGLAGVLSTFLSDTEKDRFDELMAISVIRGWNGSGVAIYGKSSGLNTYKGTYSSTSLVLQSEYMDMRRGSGLSAMVGHARHPTRGDNIYEHAHPHWCKHIALVHNGTMTKVNGEFPKSTENDSALLAESIAEVGIDETIEKSSGAYALVYIDTDKKTLNLIRNEERPLFFGVARKDIKDGKLEDIHKKSREEISTLYWASEYGMLSLVLGRHFIPYIWAAPPHQLMTFALSPKSPIRAQEVRELRPLSVPPAHTKGGRKKTKTISGTPVPTDRNFKKLPEGEEGKVTRLLEPEVIHYPARVNRPNPLGRSHWDRKPFRLPSDDLNDNLPAFLRRNNPQGDMHSLVETSKGVYIPREALLKYLYDGCHYCGNHAFEGAFNRHEICWISHKDFICQECIKNTDVEAYLNQYFPGALEYFMLNN